MSVHVPIQEDNSPTPTSLYYDPNLVSKSNFVIAGKSVTKCILYYTYIHVLLIQETPNNTIKIVEQPRDQTIQFMNNEATVELTCAAESSEGYDLRYEWYCDGSADIINNKSTAKIILTRPSRNVEKKYYCKVSTVNEPQRHVESRNAVIKLEIS